MSCSTFKGSGFNGYTDDAELEDKPDQAESQDDEFTAKDAFILVGAMGFAYEEGLRERKRFSDDSD